jgi:hypothetical protein
LGLGVAVLCSVLLLLMLATAILTGDGYEITQWSISGGASVSSGGSYTLSGLAGQPDAGQMSGGDYTLDGGFEPGDRAPEFTQIYMPMMANGGG